MHDVCVHTQKLCSLQVQIKLKTQSQYLYFTRCLLCPCSFLLLAEWWFFSRKCFSNRKYVSKLFNLHFRELSNELLLEEAFYRSKSYVYMLLYLVNNWYFFRVSLLIPNVTYFCKYCYQCQVCLPLEMDHTSDHSCY